MPGLPKYLMSQVGKGKISMKQAWARFKGKRRRKSNPGRKSRSRRKSYMPRYRRKKRGRKKNSAKAMASKGLQITFALWPEVRSLIKVIQTGRYDLLPQEIILNESGLNTFTTPHTFELDRVATNQILRFAMPYLIRKAMAQVR